MDRSEAEAIYDAGRERCVEFILELSQALERLTVANARLEERVSRLEEELRKNSSNSSTPPSANPPKTRADRRAAARVRAKQWPTAKGWRNPAAQRGHYG